jgi:hypothetical protein
VFVVCGSASSWIEENLLGSTGFVGRISYTLTLEELPLPDCKRFWPDNIAAHEKFKNPVGKRAEYRNTRGNRSETRRRSATAGFTKTSSNYCARARRKCQSSRACSWVTNTVTLQLWNITCRRGAPKHWQAAGNARWHLR